MDVLNQDLGVARRIVSQPVMRITTNPEPCHWRATKKRLVFAADCCLYLQPIFKDQLLSSISLSPLLVGFVMKISFYFLATVTLTHKLQEERLN